MQKQKEITPEMRAVLHDWMVEVCEEYRLKPETLFLAVNYVDRFLSYMHVTRGKLQLVGVTAMFIAGVTWSHTAPIPGVPYPMALACCNIAPSQASLRRSTRRPWATTSTYRTTRTPSSRS
jgi:hypothetical protein